MQDKKIIITGAVLTAIIAVVGFSVASYAYDGNFSERGNRSGFNSENREAMDSAFVNNDYYAWKELMGDRPVTEKINEDNFSQFAKAHQLMLDGDMEGVKVIFDELGLEPRGGKGFMRGGRGMHAMNKNGQGPRFVDENKDGSCDYMDRELNNNQE